MKHRNNGQFARKRESLVILPILAVFLVAGAYFWLQGASSEPLFIQPDYIPTARASEIIIATEPEKITDKEAIKKLIVQAFPEDPETAVALATSESRGLQPNIENRGKANGKYRGECSIGLFQINLASDGCEGKKVHWNKVPGETLEQKVTWLKVPENNIKIARDIYESSNGWNPWGAFTDGSYKNHLK